VRILPLLAGACSLVVGAALPALAAEEPVGRLTDNLVIESRALGYDLQYRVWSPTAADSSSALPVLFLTDGQWYLEPGGFDDVLATLIEDGAIEPLIAVFVDNRDPGNLDINRRNGQFFCNPRYIEFFEKELVPAIDRDWPTSGKREDRAILGLSFGGLNSACFGLEAHETFGGIAMQSPALHPVPSIYDSWLDREALPLRIFLSTGSANDNEASTRRLRDILRKKGYDLHYVEVPFGHEWKNWQPLLDDVLLFLFARNPV
jgi:enterochelin esterase-like enzyme